MIIEFTDEYLDDPDYTFMKGIDRGVKVYAEVYKPCTEGGENVVIVKGSHMMAWANFEDLGMGIQEFADEEWAFLPYEYRVASE